MHWAGSKNIEADPFAILILVHTFVSLL